jgi:phosphatidylserine/phosphatidylglycerophosphate/cardiolipin synthase-like enzyme
MYSLTKDGISQAVVRAHQRGVKVRVVVDKTQAGLQAADDELLEQSGIVVKRISGMGGGLMHHKFAIIDDETILTGSYNWTDNATSRNSENLNVLCSPIRSYKKEFERLWEKQP